MMPSDDPFDSSILPPARQGSVVALGNFDGVHLGHGAVLRTALTQAQQKGGGVQALTFEPHPRFLFQKDEAPFLLTPPDMKARLLKEVGADEVVVLPFTPAFAALSAEDFVKHVLLETYAPAHVVVGFDFVFGAARTGNCALLRDLLASHGIGLSEVPPWKDTRGQVVSSTRVREALRRGDPLLARQLLGRPFAIEGKVLHGDKRGQEIGFPTANIDMGPFIRPLFGVYAAKVRHAGDEEAKPAVVNIGVRPTVDGSRELMEAHILDFDQDIYGQNWSIELWAFMRPEKKFPDLEALKVQIAKDAAEAHRFSGL